MRSTNLQFRNPDEITPDFYGSVVTHNGTNMRYVKYKNKSVKGTIS